jgi:hypothetical protein
MCENLLSSLLFGQELRDAERRSCAGRLEAGAGFHRGNTLNGRRLMVCISTPEGRHMRRLLLAYALVGFTAVLRAEEPPKMHIPDKDANLLEFARAHPRCSGFTDLCQTCIRGTDQEIKCSTPGIACVKQAWTCTREDSEKQ